MIAAAQTTYALYKDFIDRYRAGGCPLASYRCPDCGETIETPQPPAGDVYDSMTVCPYCEGYHYKVVNDHGHVSTKTLYGGVA